MYWDLRGDRLLFELAAMGRRVTINVPLLPTPETPRNVAELAALACYHPKARNAAKLKALRELCFRVWLHKMRPLPGWESNILIVPGWLCLSVRNSWATIARYELKPDTVRAVLEIEAQVVALYEAVAKDHPYASPNCEGRGTAAAPRFPKIIF